MRDDVDMDIARERVRQDEKWGEQNHDPFVYLTVLGEEYGEACKAALEAHKWIDGHRSSFWDAEKMKHLREELIQVAAVAKAIVECIDRGKIL